MIGLQGRIKAVRVCAVLGLGVAAVACGSDSTDEAVRAVPGPVANPGDEVSPAGDMSAARRCAAAYGQAPFFATIDVEPPADVASATRRAHGQLRGQLLSIGVEPGAPEEVSAVIDDVERVLELETTEAVLTVVIDEISDALTTAPNGATAVIRLPFSRAAAGGPDPAKAADDLVAACPAGIPIVAFPRSASAEGDSVQIEASSYALLLTDGADDFVVMNPFVDPGEPYRMTSLRGLEEAAEASGIDVLG